MLLSQIEMKLDLNKKIGLEVSIETALGMLNVKEIAFASPRLETLVFGIADYGASLTMPTSGISGHGGCGRTVSWASLAIPNESHGDGGQGCGAGGY